MTTTIVLRTSSNDYLCAAAVGKCKAKYTHQGNMAPPGDSRPLLQFQLNDVIEVLDNSTNPNWWEVRRCARVRSLEKFVCAYFGVLLV